MFLEHLHYSLGHMGRITVLFRNEAHTSVRVIDGKKVEVCTPSVMIEMF